MARIEKQGNNIVWVVSSATMGIRMHATIDDATGKILKVEKTGVR